MVGGKGGVGLKTVAGGIVGHGPVVVMPNGERFGCMLWAAVGKRFNGRSPAVRGLAFEERVARPGAELAKGGG